MVDSIYQILRATRRFNIINRPISLQISQKPKSKKSARPWDDASVCVFESLRASPECACASRSALRSYFELHHGAVDQNSTLKFVVLAELLCLSNERCRTNGAVPFASVFYYPHSSPFALYVTFLDGLKVNTLGIRFACVLLLRFLSSAMVAEWRRQAQRLSNWTQTRPEPSKTCNLETPGADTRFSHFLSSKRCNIGCLSAKRCERTMEKW